MASKRQIDIDMRMHEFGQRARANWAKKHPAPSKNLEVFKDAIREQWEKEQAKNYEMPSTEPIKAPEREPEGPDMGM
jgi:hypothetical protein